MIGPKPQQGARSHAPGRVTTLPYYKSLDGVRGVAVLMVIFIHSRLMPFGWVGVQVFFVLSGYLITGILLTQTDRPFPTFIGRFYKRRGLRIWPLYFLFLLLCAIAYAWIRIPATWPLNWGWLVTFTYNLRIILPNFHGSDYFDHFWTLCIEEQFYLVWPFLVFLLPIRQFRRLAFLMILAGPIIRYATGAFFSVYFDTPEGIRRAVHHLPTSHMDAFAAGALLAALPASLRARFAPKAARILGGTLAVTIAAGLLHCWRLQRHDLPPHWLALGYDNLQEFHQYVWAYSLLNLSSLCLIFCALESPMISNLLSFRALVFIGVISYGVYVWHLPLLATFTLIWPADFHALAGVVRFAVYFLATLAVSTVCYFCFERHFLRLNHSPSSRRETQMPFRPRAHDCPPPS